MCHVWSDNCVVNSNDFNAFGPHQSLIILHVANSVSVHFWPCCVHGHASLKTAWQDFYILPCKIIRISPEREFKVVTDPEMFTRKIVTCVVIALNFSLLNSHQLLHAVMYCWQRFPGLLRQKFVGMVARSSAKAGKRTLPCKHSANIHDPDNEISSLEVQFKF